MATKIGLSPEFQPFPDLLDQHPTKSRALFRYVLVLAMIDDEKARVIGTRMEDGQEWLTVQTVAGDAFEIMRPPIWSEAVLQMRVQMKQIIAEEQSG